MSAILNHSMNRLERMTRLPLNIQRHQAVRQLVGFCGTRQQPHGRFLLSRQGVSLGRFESRFLFS